MRTVTRLPLLLIAALTTAAGARAESFAVDPSHTSAVFSISHLGYSYTYGMFRKTSGAFEFDKADPAASSFNFALDVASVDTMDAKRDEHLRSADFFNARQFPQISFVSSRVDKSVGANGGEVYNVTGKLTMHGVSKEVTLPLKYLGEGQGPYGNYRLGFICQTTLKRSDFGMNFMIGGIGDNVGVTISFEGIRK